MTKVDNMRKVVIMTKVNYEDWNYVKNWNYEIKSQLYSHKYCIMLTYDILSHNFDSYFIIYNYDLLKHALLSHNYYIKI